MQAFWQIPCLHSSSFLLPCFCLFTNKYSSKYSSNLPVLLQSPCFNFHPLKCLNSCSLLACILVSVLHSFLKFISLIAFALACLYASLCFLPLPCSCCFLPYLQALLQFPLWLSYLPSGIRSCALLACFLCFSSHMLAIC